jgi:LPS-assembly protein
LPLLFLYLPVQAAAQEPATQEPVAQERVAAAPMVLDGEEQRVNFTADQLTYDTESEVVTVTGSVQMTSEGNNLRADRVIWNRKATRPMATASS